MSEYQYYEFVAVKRCLDEVEMAELRSLSTRARITPTSFVNTYEWGDFRGDPCVLMERYFDGFVHVTNWGTHRLMLRVPQAALAPAKAGEYATSEVALVSCTGDHVVLDVWSEDENAEFDWEGDDRWLGSLIGLRSDLLRGDVRPLYLMWLHAVGCGDLDDDALEPEIPSGLRSLNASQAALVDFLRIDADLLATAAEASGEQTQQDADPRELAERISGLPVAENDSLLTTLAVGEPYQARAELLQLLVPTTSGGQAQDSSRRSVGELIAQQRAMA